MQKLMGDEGRGGGGGGGGGGGVGGRACFSLLTPSVCVLKYFPVVRHLPLVLEVPGSISCRTATLDFFSIWLNLKSQCFCALS